MKLVGLCLLASAGVAPFFLRLLDPVSYEQLNSFMLGWLLPLMALSIALCLVLFGYMCGREKMGKSNFFLMMTLAFVASLFMEGVSLYEHKLEDSPHERAVRNRAEMVAQIESSYVAARNAAIAQKWPVSQRLGLAQASKDRREALERLEEVPPRGEVVLDWIDVLRIVAATFFKSFVMFLLDRIGYSLGFARTREDEKVVEAEERGEEREDFIQNLMFHALNVDPKERMILLNTLSDISLRRVSREKIVEMWLTSIPEDVRGVVDRTAWLKNELLK